MPRKRLAKNNGLPLRWTLDHGAYYYRVPVGQEHQWDGKKKFRLGVTLREAHVSWASRIASDDIECIRSIGDLLDKYSAEVVPTKSPATQAGNMSLIKQIRSVFGKMPLIPFPPRLIYQYVRIRSAKKIDKETGKSVGGKTAAHREVEILSHAYTKAVEWGFIDKHPFKGEVRLEGEKARDRYIEDWEIVECLSIDSKRKKGSVSAIHAYIRLKLMTGMARGDLLRLTTSDLREDGIHIKRHKTANSTGKRTIYAWTDELRKAIADAKAARPALSPFVFCNRLGEGYIDEQKGSANGWDSMWGRFMDRVLKETKITERFTEHDLRAKCASDAETLEHARALLSHADSRTTDAIYRRKPEVVRPLKGASQ